jgi:glyoxylase-like metal-dependent hydrolase (beta-lactamase superfamily II)
MPEGSHRFEVGSLYCSVLADGYVSCPAPWFFPNADRSRLAQALERRRLPLETVLSPCTCLLIQTGRNVVLVDAGAGEGSPTTGAIPARLEMEGIRLRDVDTVVLTHAHSDHIGGAVDARGRPAFPNARYIISEAEWDFWTAGPGDLRPLRVPEVVKASISASARRCLAALRHHIETISGEKEILPGVSAVPAPGHTPGHLAVMLSSGGRRLLNIGDAAVHPLHLEEPDWENGFDLEAPRAVATRRELLERAAAGNMGVMAFHFPFPSLGTVTAGAAGGWTWSPGW